MPKSTRREFLIQTSVGVAGIALLPSNRLAAAPKKYPGIPPHREMVVPGVHGYSDRTSVAAGEKIKFHISSTAPYRLSIYRLGLDVDNPDNDEILHTFDTQSTNAQPIHPGSYIFVQRGLERIKGLTLECWVRPWKIEDAGIITQYDFETKCGIGLFMKANGGLSFYLGDGRSYDAANSHSTKENKIKVQRWHHIVATWNGKEKAIWINGKRIGHAPFPYRVFGGETALRIGAFAQNGEAGNFLNADIAMPAVYTRALTADEISARYDQRGLQRAEGKDVWACWDLSEEKGDRLKDVSGNGREGLIVNHATWMIGGPSFNSEVIRFVDYDPKKDDERGHGLRLASDDLYDCRWEAKHEFEVPKNARPGFYVGRIRYELDGIPRMYHITFIVRKPTGRAKAPILLLAATNTWKAYSATPFAKTAETLKRVATTAGMPNTGDAPAFSFYRTHAAGQGTFQLGWRMPFVGADPYLLYGEKADYSHLARAERFGQTWLEQSGYEYDVISDYDLHSDPSILKGYKTFVINGHSEYWSASMYESLQQYLKGGGNVMVLSGNSLFWRVSFNDGGSIIECRKVDAPGRQMDPVHRGESWHSQDGKRGGLLREAGYPGWKLIGLETLGWTGVTDIKMFGSYEAEATSHFLFNEPEKVGLAPGQTFAQAENGLGPRGNGHEMDVRLSTLAALQEEGSPAGAEVPPDPPGKMVRLANGVIPWDIGGSAFDYFFRPIHPNNRQGGEMIYWERAEGGKVFNAGSIGAGWGLSVDPKFQTLLRNVLAHFGVKPKK